MNHCILKLILNFGFLLIIAGIVFAHPLANSATAQIESAAPKPSTNLFSIPNSPASTFTSTNRVKIAPAKTPALTYGRAATEIKSALNPIVKKFQSSVVELETEYGRKSLGTIISKDRGLIIAKHSELTGDFFCRIGDEKHTCRLLALHLINDLALVAISPSGLDELTQIEFPEISKVAIGGKMVVSIGSDGIQGSLGVVSVLPTQFDVSQPKRNEGIDFGSTVSRWTVSKPVQTNNGTTFKTGLEVQRVYPRSIAERAGLLKGDLLQTVNGIQLYGQVEFKSLASRLRVGQKVEFTVIREGIEKQLSTRIESFTPKTIHDRWGGGPFSEKRFGFGRVISHDTVITPEQCGGPLVDLHGNIVGINIARSMRVASFAIPINDVEHFVAQALTKIGAKPIR